MHFFYIDESGDTGGDLLNAEQPINDRLAKQMNENRTH